MSGAEWVCQGQSGVCQGQSGGVSARTVCISESLGATSTRRYAKAVLFLEVCRGCVRGVSGLDTFPFLVLIPMSSLA